jgi:hypothetical protein
MRIFVVSRYAAVRNISICMATGEAAEIAADLCLRERDYTKAA